MTLDRHHWLVRILIPVLFAAITSYVTVRAQVQVDSERLTRVEQKVDLIWAYLLNHK